MENPLLFNWSERNSISTVGEGYKTKQGHKGYRFCSNGCLNPTEPCGHVIAAYGLRDWFMETDYCLEKVVSPCDSTLANIATDATFAAATFGLYILGVILSCAGFGLARM